MKKIKVNKKNFIVFKHIKTKQRMTYKQIEDTTNNLGWGFKRNRKEFCFENWTSRGQNLVYENTCTSAKDIVEQVTEYVRGYDVDEEVCGLSWLKI